MADTDFAQPGEGVSQAPETSYRGDTEASPETTQQDEQITESAEPEYQMPAAWQQDENFRNYQSARDKRESALRKQADAQAKELAALRADLEKTQTQFTQQATNRADRDNLINNLGTLDKALSQVTEGSEAWQSLRTQAQGLEQQLMRIDINIKAAEFGVDPDDPLFERAIKSGAISDLKDIENIALRLALQGGTKPPPEPEPKGKQAPVSEDKLRKQIEADILQKYGLTPQTPTVKPAGTPSTLDAARKRYKELEFVKGSGAFQERMRLLDEHPELAGT